MKLEEKYRQKGMSDEEAEKAASKRIRKEKIAVGAAAVVAAYAGYKLADSGELNRIAQKGKAFIHGSPPQWRKKPELADTKMSAEDIFDRVVMGIFNNDDIDHSGPINRDYGYGGATGLGTKNNCRRCTFAYELRRREYDVQATKSRSATGQTSIGMYNALNKKEVKGGIIGALSRTIKELHDTGSSELSDYLDKHDSGNGTFGTPIKMSSNHNSLSKTIFETLSKTPHGSRGEITVVWKKGSGHSMAWENVKGKPVIFDCQTGSIFDSPKSLKEGRWMNKAKNVAFMRLDNLELNNDFLLKWVKDSSGFRRK